ncbi:peroxisome proliferator-activated receptor gamma coactivator-related protein 1-like isoform X2 [Gouania willdenowi]|uniref:peroxisome proliferator-activated receptor gamma coactivator-related protein 1-like isoform X2 n=1 Tax=Gouania willdenowi TaxID=441366 RepID=UPI0010544A1A|nr:peroxisome proliferator-activated receptor gamma coactivator-related protein 1-like isoform X2 [Gouania willdenowi]
MAAAPQEVQTSLTDTDTHSGTTSGSPVHTQSAAEPHQRNSNPKTPSSPHPGSPKTSLFSALLSQPPALPPTASHTSMSEEPLSPPDEPSPPGNSCKQDRPATDSGIEACDLTSLLEQFEETQAKEARVCIQPKPVLCGSAFNQVQDASSETKSTSPSFIKPPESLETPETSRTQITPQQDPDLQSLGDEVVPEPLCTETIQSSQQDPPRRTPPPPKAIQIIHPRPLPSKRTHMSSTESPVARLPPHVFSYVSFEHDYCEPVGHPPTPQQNSSKDPRHLAAPQQNRSKDPRHPEQTNRAGSEASTEEALQTPPCSLPTPPPSPPVRGRRKRRYRSRSSRSDSSSCSSSSSSSSCSSACRSPKRPRLHRQSSQSSSCSSSPSSIDSPPRRNRLSYSKSRSSRSISRSWSQSRSPSRSPSPSQYACRRRWRDVCRESRRIRREHEIRMQKLRAIDERRVVYVGRIRTTMTHEELRDRFAQFGNVECVSLHFRDRGGPLRLCHLLQHGRCFLLPSIMAVSYGSPTSCHSTSALGKKTVL